ncbi:hypothetical protein ACGF3J_16365 [Streptomyces sp. NPDC048171]|uniref:hypothetical protein n=1 Tax=unclassified Streptomyces TaxID=2593676 RepID=UPI0019288681|nr:hypothetical protein [Streptomyces sp. SID5789]
MRRECRRPLPEFGTHQLVHEALSRPDGKTVQSGEQLVVPLGKNKPVKVSAADESLQSINGIRRPI